MNSRERLEQIFSAGIVPVVTIEKLEHALPLADALSGSGLNILEITFRSTLAAEAIGLLSRERPQLTVGAGTVLTFENVEAACEAGAKFAVAPGLTPINVKLAGELGLPFVPGVATATEVEQALTLGCRLLKFFPAELLGGVEMIKALAAPFSHMDVRFFATGGIGPANLESYLACSYVAAVGGTWLARREDLEANRWTDIAHRCSLAMETLRRMGRSKG